MSLNRNGSGNIPEICSRTWAPHALMRRKWKYWRIMLHRWVKRSSFFNWSFFFYLMRHVEVFPNVLLIAQIFTVSAPKTVRNPSTKGEVNSFPVPHDKELSRWGRRSTSESWNPGTSSGPDAAHFCESVVTCDMDICCGSCILMT